MMEVVQTPTFKRQLKKLHLTQKKELDNVIRDLMKDPSLGQKKKGDLKGVSVYKFKMGVQLILLAYSFDEKKLVLLAFGTHENFYRDLKS